MLSDRKPILARTYRSEVQLASRVQVVELSVLSDGLLQVGQHLAFFTLEI